MEFISVLIPIFGIFAIGFVGYKFLRFEIKPISKMALYLMSPFLAFRTFFQNDLNMDYLYLGAFLVVLCAITIGICYLIGRMKRWGSGDTSSLILATAFMNNGNYGTPLVLLVFGEKGFHYAIILMVLQQLIMCTVGVYIAAKGGADGKELKVSPLREVIRVPIVYGALLGILFNALHIEVNENIMTAVDMVSDATIPTIMIVLGMQLANISLKRLELGKLSTALLFRLAIAPVIAYVLTLPLPVDEMVKDILILMAAMPTAANTTMYALQFDAKPEFVSSATLTSTLLSIITLPIILAILL
ncbi:AEC family transporter [Aquibacillus koreensis]|uniref:AEC family transporter n=1 Tax=Aquibacillus koreensis TaxID=279446 RepID=A0A9X3WLZ4_9BACI|nr:AEC family transporter [Aquibacillus koreensis]MCT2537736.1 AEC family transporter [Aquibacillus koreensis]MDC3421230.1 AEC family transporter [Aquibacillus koreensis]